MAESFLFDLAANFITKLGSLALQELGLLLGVNDELEKLKDTVSSIKAVLLDAEEQQSNSHAVKEWLSRLKDVFYDIDDLMDEFKYEAMRRQVMTRNRRKTKQVRIFFSKSNQIAFSHEMGGKIKEIRGRLKVINDDRTQFTLSERVINKPTVDVFKNIRDPGDYIPEKEVIGRNDDKKVIIDLLLNSNTKEDIPVVAIVGMGGLGKTTLAQSVYNDNMMKNHFELKLWVCISEEFDVKVIIEKIIEYGTKKKSESFLQMAPLQSKLRELVDGKKYLLVMDDVWNKDHEKWDSLKRLLMGGAKGSRILITTREEQVANTFDPTSLYPLEKLNEKNSWLLFEKMALGSEGAEKDPQNSNLVEIGKEIVTKLNGIPLAIRTIGRLLYDNKSKDFWLSFKDKELYQIMEQGGVKDMLSILKLSYNHLPSNLKQCFLYCALFPKDYEIQKDEVIMQWVAQGFVQPNDKDKLVDIGEDYFMELLSRSFFQDVTEDELGDIEACKMHDLMHDLACSIVENECVHDVNARALNKRTHHVSIDLMSWEELEKLPEKLSETRNLRTCFLQYDEKNFIKNFNKIFGNVLYNISRVRTLDLKLRIDNQSAKFLKCISKMKHLRYLKIEMDIKNWTNLKHLHLQGNGEIEFLPNSITELCELKTLILQGCRQLKELPRDVKNWINLKHLDISSSGVEFLPESITQLKTLETLLLCYCDKLKELPGDMKKLINLKQLDIQECSALTHMPKGLGELTNLQTINLFVLGKDNNGGGLSELNGLNKLRGSLTIERLQFCTTSDLQTNAKLLQLKSGLQILRLEWEWDKNSFNDPTVSALDDEYDKILESLQPHSNLQEIHIKGYKGVKLCNWLSSSSYSFGCLVWMELSSCERLQHLPQFDQFPNLKNLWLEDLPNIEHIADNNDYPCSSTNLFPSLERLFITRMPKLKRWWKKAQNYVVFPIIFPCLSQLEIYNDCPLLTSITCTHAPSKSLERNDSIEYDIEPDELDVSWKCFPSLSDLLVSDIYEWEFLSNGLQHVTTLRIFSINECPNLKSLPESIGNLTSLSKLEILNCENLKSLPKSIGNLTSLSELKILSCENLKSLPESIGKLTSLTKLSIWYCPELTSLPEGIRHLHCLQSLRIFGCPILKERCKKETGEDWPKIANIRAVFILGTFL